MIINGREIVFKTKFLRDLKDIREYILDFTVQGEINFVKGVEEMVFEKIPPQPFRYPEFKHMPTKAKIYRKALYRKKWNIIYKVEEKKLTYIRMYHLSRDVSKLKFSE